MGKQTIRQALHQLTHHTTHSDTPALDAQVLLAHIIQKSRAWVLAYPETTLTPSQQKSLNQAIKQLENHIPLPYILEHWEFYGLDFTLSPDVLIPRPETELLIEEALHWLQTHPQKRRAADLGTGSGCIAITLAKHISDLHIAASDISLAALKIARANAEKHRVAERIEFIHANLLADNLQPTTLDLLAANLPYIPTQTLHTLDVHEREPTLALDGGENGLKLIGRALEQARRNLARGWLMLFEIDSSHGERAVELAHQHYPHANIRILPDLTGRDRLLRIEDNLCKPD
ncbi:MAG: peptide chain release factor N(5)-glutamine methyltransferase [Anaerolineae bacterium]|nr:peptide chain release factor N(5)-glutamine methyltransferase [Anaerolineae bacterium]